MNTPISTLLKRRSFAPVTVSRDVSVLRAVLEMNKHSAGSVLVMDGHRLEGIFTERDVLTKVVAVGLDPSAHNVGDVMTVNPVTLRSDATVRDALELFNVKRCRHMPIVDDSLVLGLISIRDVSAWLVDAHREEAEQLRQYITGGSNYPA
jgi:CBS domain-containing protein